MIPEERYAKYLLKKEQIESEIARLREVIIKPNEKTQEVIVTVAMQLKDGIGAGPLVKRTEMNYELVASLSPSEIGL
ncbi:tRNA uridine 5-carboxymethylaminomethyl modification enzyme MnmG OS=Ureibacillus acetophenoni OX=614649 GN=mnmG PE=3 SV=1 [Ureibacillus acetophenoni]